MAWRSKAGRKPSSWLDETMNLSSSLEWAPLWACPLAPNSLLSQAAKRSTTITNGSEARKIIKRIGAAMTESFSARANPMFFGTTSPATTRVRVSTRNESVTLNPCRKCAITTGTKGFKSDSIWCVMSSSNWPMTSAQTLMATCTTESRRSGLASSLSAAWAPKLPSRARDSRRERRVEINATSAAAKKPFTAVTIASSSSL